MENNNRVNGFYGGIPEGWEVRELETLLEFKNGINAGKESYGEGIKFINVMEVIYNDLITIEKIPGSLTISEEQQKTYLVKNGDILFNRTSETTGEVGLTSVYQGTEEVVFGGFVIRGRPVDNSLDNAFKRYCFRTETVRNQIIKSGQGVVRSNIGQGDLGKVKILLPPLPEQRAIATCLSTWDMAIQKCTELLAQKELRKKWLMQQLLTGKKRLKGFEGEWKEVRMNEVFEEINDTNDGEKGHVIMTISSKHGLISQEDKFDRVIAGESLKKYTLLKRFDFAYNKGNSKAYQMGCIYQLEGQESALVPFVYICFRPTGVINSTFYKHWFLAHGLDRQLKKIITSGARGDGLLNVDSRDFFDLNIPFPSLEEQTAIARILQTADQEIQLLKARLGQLKEQKRGMMQVLLTGRVRLDPASFTVKQDII